MDQGKLLQYARPDEIVAHPATEFVGELLGSGERPFRLLSLPAGRSDLVEPGEAAGRADRRDNDAARRARGGLWSGRDAVPVAGPDGAIIGRVTLSTVVQQAARPA